jgi:hypothetical protein
VHLLGKQEKFAHAGGVWEELHVFFSDIETEIGSVGHDHEREDLEVVEIKRVGLTIFKALEMNTFVVDGKEAFAP